MGQQRVAWRIVKNRGEVHLEKSLHVSEQRDIKSSPFIEGFERSCTQRALWVFHSYVLYTVLSFEF